MPVFLSRIGMCKDLHRSIAGEVLLYGVCGKPGVIIIPHFDGDSFFKHIVRLQVIHYNGFPRCNHLIFFYGVGHIPMERLSGKEIKNSENESLALMGADPLIFDIHFYHLQRHVRLYPSVFDIRLCGPFYFVI